MQPLLQRQDGNFIGTTLGTNSMVGFTPSGQTLFTVPNDTPQIATANNGVIGASGTTYDQNGNVNGYIANAPTQSWTGNEYRLGSIDQIVSNLINLAGSFWPQLGANASANSTAVIQEKLYVRSFAPWYSFGPDPYAFTGGYTPIANPCLFNCFLGDNRTFTTDVGGGVTSRINGSVRLLFPDMVPIGKDAYSNLTTAIYRLPPLNTGTATPTITISQPPADDTLDLQLEGADPLVPIAPNIDVYLNLTANEITGQVCYSGQLSGDAFPNAEVFVVNSKGQATTLLTFATSYPRNWGPWSLISPNIVSMGSFSNICVQK